MKRTASIDLRIVPVIAAAAIAAGCGTPANQAAVRHCMDNTKTLVEPSKCDEEARRAARHPGPYVYAPLYHWVLGPRGAAVGTHIGGNPAFYRASSPASAPGSPSTTTRGGFGSSARPVAS
jgi:hypothetical protein